MKRILVTGASGFVGRALIADLAARGYRVRAASRTMQPVRQGVEQVSSPDLAGNPDWAPLLDGVDAVVHAAAVAHADRLDEAAHDAINRRAVIALAQAAQGRVERLVFLSSIRAQSGPAAADTLTEADDPRPSDAYGRAKLAAEQALAGLGVPAVILRPVLVAGPQPRGNLATMLRFAKLRLGRLPLPLPFAGLASRRSLIARADLCAAVAHVLDDRAHIGKTYIVAHPEPIGIAAMFAALRAGLGHKPHLFAVPGPLLRAAMPLAGMGGAEEKLFGELVASAAKLMATGWAAEVAPRQALAEIGAAALAKP